MVPMYGGQQSLRRWSGSARNSSGRQHLSKQSSSSDLLERINCPQNRRSVAAGNSKMLNRWPWKQKRRNFIGGAVG